MFAFVHEYSRKLQITTLLDLMEDCNTRIIKFLGHLTFVAECAYISAALVSGAVFVEDNEDCSQLEYIV